MHKVSVFYLIHADIQDYVYYVYMLCSYGSGTILFSIPFLQEKSFCLPLTNVKSSKLQ